MTDPQRRGLRALVLAASVGTELDPALEWIRLQLEMDAARRADRGPHFSSHAYWASRRFRG